MRRTRMRNREFDGFDDPVVKILLGVGIALTVMFFTAAFLEPWIGAASFIMMLKSIMWILGAYAVVGAIFGLVRSIQYGRARRSRNA